MFQRLAALLALCCSLLFAGVSTAHAEVKVASVNMQRAINEVNEGKTANAQLEKMMADKKAALEKMKSSFDALQADYQKQQMLLSDSARKQKEDEINMAGMQLQQAIEQSNNEFQGAYNNAMSTLIGKMKVIVGTISTERQYTMVVEVSEGSSVVWAAPSIDITDEVIKRYNAQNPGK